MTRISSFLLVQSRHLSHGLNHHPSGEGKVGEVRVLFMLLLFFFKLPHSKIFSMQRYHILKYVPNPINNTATINKFQNCGKLALRWEKNKLWFWAGLVIIKTTAVSISQINISSVSSLDFFCTKIVEVRQLILILTC